jgi:hypothetical protein
VRYLDLKEQVAAVVCLVSLPDRRLEIFALSLLGFLALALGGLRGLVLLGLAPE